ncbi:MAG: hypothetical protein ABII12_05190 [Planctomycetota bacterium]
MTGLITTTNGNKAVLSARLARHIRRGCQGRSANPHGLGVSELFTAPPQEASIILAARDLRLKRYLLGG